SIHLSAGIQHCERSPFGSRHNRKLRCYQHAEAAARPSNHDTAPPLQGAERAFVTHESLSATVGGFRMNRLAQGAVVVLTLAAMRFTADESVAQIIPNRARGTGV